MLIGKKAAWLLMVSEREQMTARASRGRILEGIGCKGQGVGTSQVEPGGKRRT